MYRILVHERFDLKLKRDIKLGANVGLDFNSRHITTRQVISQVQEDIQEHKNLLLIHFFSGAYWKMICRKS